MVADAPPASAAARRGRRRLHAPRDPVRVGAHLHPDRRQPAQRSGRGRSVPRGSRRALSGHPHGVTGARAVSRSTMVALYFEVDGRGTRFSIVEDGNGDGVRTTNIEDRIDRVIEAPVLLSDLFPGASIGIAAGIPATAAVALSGTNTLSFSPSGTATSGSVYIVGRDGTKCAVRVLGVTGAPAPCGSIERRARGSMPADVEDRRRMVHRVPACTEALCRVRLRAGRELSVINVSPSGALVEGLARLLPGTNVDVHITAHGRILVRARVMRCAVWTVTADVVVYRGALAFTTEVDLPIAVAASEPVADSPADQRTAVSPPRWLSRAGAASCELLGQSYRVELSFPSRDDDRRDTVADEVGEGPCPRHEPIDAEDERQAGDENRRHDRQHRTCARGVEADHGHAKEERALPESFLSSSTRTRLPPLVAIVLLSSSVGRLTSSGDRVRIDRRSPRLTPRLQVIVASPTPHSGA